MANESGAAMLRILVTPDAGDPHTVNVAARDILVWERTGKGRSFGDFARGGMTMADVYSLAHITSRRLGLTDLPLAGYEASVDVLPLGDEDDGPDPTPQGH